MCIICVLPVGTTISDEELKNCWDNNDDGAGFMYVNPNSGNIAIKKFMNFDRFQKSFRSTFDLHKNETPFVLHFRIGTHGSNSIENVHPFRVNDNVAFCHNGVLSCVETAGDMSDTRAFNEVFMRDLPYNFTRNNSIMTMINQLIGHSYNKFVFLDRDKNVTIINEKLGEKSEGRWFSNGSFRKYARGMCGTNSFYEEWYDDEYIKRYQAYAGKQYYIPRGQNWAPESSDLFTEYCTICSSYVAEDDFWKDLQCCDTCLEDVENIFLCELCNKAVHKDSYSHSYKACIECAKYIEEDDKAYQAYKKEQEELDDIQQYWKKDYPSLHSMTMGEWESAQSNMLKARR